MLFAQDVLTFGGVVQAVMQGGAVVLLGILVWQLPVLLREIKTWRVEADMEHRKERDEWRTERDVHLRAFREEIKFEREHCSEESERSREVMVQNQQVTHQALDKLGSAVDRVGESVRQHDALAREAIKRLVSAKDTDAEFPVYKREGG